jgi:peptidoglycan/LPS O-acetylase OafA/YrhL
VSAGTSVRQSGIAPGLSLYLELLRFLAAVTVVIYHTWHFFDPGMTFKLPGHEAVVVFFVLSGYVIAHAASRPGVTLAIYAQHRMARILPVAWLALLLAAALAALVPSLNPDNGSVITHTLVNMVFMAQAGWGWMEAPINPPFWSLNYEVWYYIVFAAWMFVRRHRWFWIGVALLLAGPKILLLMPIWLMGVALYRHMPTLGRAPAVLVFIATVVIAACMCWMDISELWRTWLYRVVPPFWRAHYSTQVLYDTVLGVVVSANFIAVASLSAWFDKLRAFERPIRYLAGFTLSLYVFHTPLTGLLLDVLHIDRPLPYYAALIVCVFVLAQLTERRTGWYRRQIARLWTIGPAASVKELAP